MLVRGAWAAAVAVAVVLSLVVSPARVVEAATAIVTSNADSGPGSLRAAVEQANNDASVTEIEIQTSGPIQLESSVVYSGAQSLAITGAGSVIEGSDTFASCIEQAVNQGLLVSRGGDLTLRNLEFRDADCRGVIVTVPGDATDSVDVTLHNVRMQDLTQGGLYVRDFDSAAGLDVRITASTFERVSTVINEAAVYVEEAAGGDAHVTMTGVTIRESSGFALEIDEDGDGSVDLRLTNTRFLANGGGLYLSEDDEGDVTARLLSAHALDNDDDGFEIDEDDEGYLTIDAVNVRSLRNASEAFEMDEDGEGDLRGNLTDVVANENEDYGVEFYEAGGGDLRVRMVSVSGSQNGQWGLYLSEEDDGKLDAQVTRGEFDGNGQAFDDSGGYIEEYGFGSLRFRCQFCSFDDNADDGAFISEWDDGDLDATFVVSSLNGNDDDGIEVWQLDTGVGRLRRILTSTTGNGDLPVEATNVTVN